MLRRLYADPAAPSAFSSLRNLQQAAAATRKQIKTPAALSRPHTHPKAAVSHAPSKQTELKQKTSSQIKAWLETQDAYTLHRLLRKRFPRNPLRTKTGKEVAAALESILWDPKYTKPIRRRPVWVRTDNGKEFLNTQFQTLLKREGIELQVCRNPDVKCAVVERVNRTLRDKLHRYFTHKNTYKYIDVLPKFIKGYNVTVHSTTGMAPADVTPTS